MLCLTAIHTDKTERDYKYHFEEDLKNLKYSTHPSSTFEDFAAGYGYTIHIADMLLSLTNS